MVHSQLVELVYSLLTVCFGSNESKKETENSPIGIRLMWDKLGATVRFKSRGKNRTNWRQLSGCGFSVYIPLLPSLKPLMDIIRESKHEYMHVHKREQVCNTETSLPYRRHENIM